MDTKYPFLRFIYIHWKKNLSIAVVYTIFLIVLVFFVFPLEYTSGVSILPSEASFSQGLLGGFGNIGKIAGIDFGSGSRAQSQEMYMGIIFSRRLLDQVVHYTYEFEEDGKLMKQNLIQYFELDDLEDEREISEKMLKAMREGVVIVNIDPENEILYLEVTTENPFLSALVADKIAEVLNVIVKTEVQKEYRQKLAYLEDRLSGIEDTLAIAENELKTFLESSSDPTLPVFQVKQIRLQRNLRLQTELLIEFRKQLEIFVADNMINLADIKVLDDAYPPYRKSRPKRALLLISLTMLAGFVQLGVNASIVIIRKYKNEIDGIPDKEDQTKT